MKRKKSSMKTKVMIVALLIAVFAAGAIFGTSFQVKVIAEPAVQKAEVAGEKRIEMTVPAVDAESNGVVGTLVTTIRPGSGQVLVNVNDVLAQFDTQLSGRTAAKAASEFTKKSLDIIDIIYDIQVNASVIEGPSAGAAMASSIVLALEGIDSNNSIVMTGRILENSTIGSVGAILEKGKAAKEAGAEIFLVPSGEGTELKSTRSVICRPYKNIELCQVKYDYSPVSIGNSLNMTVIEVGTLADIIRVFRQNSGNGEITV